MWWPSPHRGASGGPWLGCHLSGRPGAGGPGPQPGALFPASSCAWELSGAGQRLRSPSKRAPCSPCVAGGSAGRERGWGVEGGGGDREAVAVSRPWAAGAVMLRDPPLPCRRNHAGPLRLSAAADQNPGAHPGRPPVPQLRSPCFRPRAVRRQLPCPAGPLEAACAPKDGQSLVTVAPRHRLAINSLRTSSSLISISWAGGLGTRAGWSLGCWRASWRRGPAAVPQGSRESRIAQVHPRGRWVLPPESATEAREEYLLLPPRQLCPRRPQRQGAPCSPLHTPLPTPTPGLGPSTHRPHPPQPLKLLPLVNRRRTWLFEKIRTFEAWEEV